jgi:hypothetical protein
MLVFHIAIRFQSIKKSSVVTVSPQAKFPVVALKLRDTHSVVVQLVSTRSSSLGHPVRSVDFRKLIPGYAFGFLP